VVHFLFSAKFICIGKQKNRLTPIQIKYQNTRLFGNPGSIDAARRDESNGGPHSCLQCRWEQLSRFEVARARGYFRLLGICVRPQVPAQPTLYLPYSSAVQISIGQQGNPDLPTFWSSILKKWKKRKNAPWSRVTLHHGRRQPRARDGDAPAHYTRSSRRGRQPRGPWQRDTCKSP
jgi:hypothetical protein